MVMNTRLISGALLVAWWVWVAPQAFADEVQTQDGSILYGEVLHLRNTTLTVRTTFAGEISIDWQQVTNVSTKKPLPVEFDNGDRLTALLTGTSEGQIRVSTADGVFTGMMDFERIVAINPPAS